MIEYEENKISIILGDYFNTWYVYPFTQFSFLFRIIWTKW